MAMEKTLDALKQKGRDVLGRVFGTEHVQRREGSETSFSADMREYSDVCMGVVWGRPGLDLQTRRLLTITILAMQNRPRLVELHMEAALNDSCSPELLKELVMHLSLYCGWPTAVEVNNIAEQVLRSRGLDA
jgi:4-carboxymuconolactone decarboxylase